MIGRICLQMLRIHGGRTEKRSACKKDSKNSSKEFENVMTKWSRKDVPSKKSTNQQALTNILSIMAKCANQWVLISKVRNSYYGGYLEMAQKAIEGANVTCWNMHVILRWLKIGFIEFLLKFGLKQ